MGISLLVFSTHGVTDKCLTPDISGVIRVINAILTILEILVIFDELLSVDNVLKLAAKNADFTGKTGNSCSRLRQD